MCFSFLSLFFLHTSSGWLPRTLWLTPSILRFSHYQITQQHQTIGIRLEETMHHNKSSNVVLISTFSVILRAQVRKANRTALPTQGSKRTLPTILPLQNSQHTNRTQHSKSEHTKPQCIRKTCTLGGKRSSTTIVGRSRPGTPIIVDLIGRARQGARERDRDPVPRRCAPRECKCRGLLYIGGYGVGVRPSRV